MDMTNGCETCIIYYWFLLHGYAMYLKHVLSIILMSIACDVVECNGKELNMMGLNVTPFRWYTTDTGKYKYNVRFVHNHQSTCIPMACNISNNRDNNCFSNALPTNWHSIWHYLTYTLTYLELYVAHINTYHISDIDIVFISHSIWHSNQNILAIDVLEIHRIHFLY